MPDERARRAAADARRRLRAGAGHRRVARPGALFLRDVAAADARRPRLELPHRGGDEHRRTPPATWPGRCSRRPGCGPSARAARCSPAPRRPRSCVAAHGLTTADPPLYLFRFLSGLASAVAFVAGGLLAAQLVGAAPAKPRARAADRRPGARHLLRRHRARHRRLGGARCRCSPAAPWPHAWQGGWIALGALGGVVTAVIAAATRGLASASPRRRRRRARALAGFAWRRFLPALAAYLMFGLGYIGYMTFIVTLLREQRVSEREVIALLRPARRWRSRSRRGSGRGCCSASAAARRWP